MVIDSLGTPIVLAPLAGGPSTPELAGAVADAGGLGFLGAGYLTREELVGRMRATRGLTSGVIGVNVFVPGDGPTDPDAYATYAERVQGWAGARGYELGEARYSDDDWDAKLELLEADPVPVVSFTFGCPDASVIERLRRAGSEVWITVTSPEEARIAETVGADAIVAQGAEAGGHRGSFIDRPDLPVHDLLPLLGLIRDDTSLPLVASGGIAGGEAITAVLAAGARAAQIGTAFLLCPEAGTSQVHRAALRGSAATGLTRAFTGRLARGIHNRFMDELGPEAPIAYPELHFLTAPMRRQAREAGDPEPVNLWAGQAYRLAVEEPAADVVRRLAAGISSRG